MNWSSSAVATTTAPLDAYLKQLFDVAIYMCIYLLYPLWPFAMVANLLIVTIFSKTALGTTKTTRMYYMVIALCELGLMVVKDLCFFMFGFGFYAYDFDKAFPGGVYRWPVENLTACSVLLWLWFFFEGLANITYVVLGVERLIALYWPLHVRTLVTKRRMGLLLAGITVLLFAFYSQFMQVERINYVPYLLRGVSCYTGGSSEPSYLAQTTILFAVGLLIPTPVTAILSVCIAVKIRSFISSKLDASGSKSMTAKQLEYFITPVIMSTLHLCFYVPLAVTRVAAIVLPYVMKMTVFQGLTLLAIGPIFHVGIMPVHLMNFVLYCARVPGFWTNVKLVLSCKCSKIILDAKKH